MWSGTRPVTPCLYVGGVGDGSPSKVRSTPYLSLSVLRTSYLICWTLLLRIGSFVDHRFILGYYPVSNRLALSVTTPPFSLLPLQRHLPDQPLSRDLHEPDTRNPSNRSESSPLSSPVVLFPDILLLRITRRHSALISGDPNESRLDPDRTTTRQSCV